MLIFENRTYIPFLKIQFMKALFLLVIFSMHLTTAAQYYYKDIVGTKETSDMLRAYKTNNVKKVILTSYDHEGQKIEDFFVEQIFNSTINTLTTITRSSVSGESFLVSYIDHENRVIRTIDSSQSLISHTNYTYNNDGDLILVASTSYAPGSDLKQHEEHIWEYNNDKIIRMIRVKNHVDTTYLEFTQDETGNIIEESGIRKLMKSEPVYYYYDKQNRLTDIVRFNRRVRKLLPEYMFEYSGNNQVVQKLTFPANNSNYLIWRYQYDNRGLKIQEAVFDKQKKLTGRVKYEYSF